MGAVATSFHHRVSDSCVAARAHCAKQAQLSSRGDQRHGHGVQQLVGPALACTRDSQVEDDGSRKSRFDAAAQTFEEEHRQPAAGPPTTMAENENGMMRMNRNHQSTATKNLALRHI